MNTLSLRTFHFFQLFEFLHDFVLLLEYHLVFIRNNFTLGFFCKLFVQIFCFFRAPIRPITFASNAVPLSPFILYEWTGFPTTSRILPLHTVGLKSLPTILNRMSRFYMPLPPCKKFQQIVSFLQGRSFGMGVDESYRLSIVQRFQLGFYLIEHFFVLRKFLNQLIPIFKLVPNPYDILLIKVGITRRGIRLGVKHLCLCSRQKEKRGKQNG